jgi:hypothetical protein
MPSTTSAADNAAGDRRDLEELQFDLRTLQNRQGVLLGGGDTVSGGFFLKAPD